MNTIDPAFIDAHTSVVTMRDGTRIRLRPVLPEDRDDLAAAVERLSPEARYRRFMAPIHRLTAAQARYLTEIDYADHFAWVAFAMDEPNEPGIGVSRYVRDRAEPDVAEAAVAVLDDYHGRGIGTLLLEALAIEAADNGIKRFRGVALADNAPIKALLDQHGARFTPPAGGEVGFEFEIPAAMGELQRSPLYAALREAARAPHPPFIHPSPFRHPHPPAAD